MRFSDAIRALESDALDYDQIETRVQHLIPSTVVINGICAECQHLLNHWPIVSGAEIPAVGRHFHTNELEAAARQGCRFCACLVAVLEEEREILMLQKVEARLRAVGDDGTASLSIAKLDASTHEGQMLRLNVPGKTGREFMFPITSRIFSHFLQPSANLWGYPVVDPFEIARMWLARCSGWHERCRRTRQNRPPTRLVSIANGVVKLVITESLPAPPRYATLSYCWGSEPFTTLTQDNLDVFLYHLPLGELPRTFIDAIDAARCLGMDYIWIDALCIIEKEENNSDWANEAGRMSDVYGGTSVNLAASTATSVHDGFIHNSRPKHRNWGFVARVTTKDSCRVQSFYLKNTFEKSTTETHLATRAWTFQERLLSPRTIHFGDTGVFWTCCAHYGSETLPDGFPSTAGERSTVEHDMPWNWVDIISQYSKAKLTYGSDRLPALSGTAAHQQHLTGGQYLAGLWRDSLATQLIWQPVYEQSCRPKWRAPTWSWASIDGEVSHQPLSNWNAYIQVMKAWTTPSGPDPYGQVSDGELAVSCAYLACGHINPNVGGFDDIEVDVKGVGRFEAWSPAFGVTIDCLGEVPTEGHNVIYFLPVIEAEGKPPAGLMTWGLILQASGDSNKPLHFQRIGCFRFKSLMGQAESQERYRTLMEALKKEGSSLAAAELAKTMPASVSDDGRFVIIIK